MNLAEMIIKGIGSTMKTHWTAAPARVESVDLKLHRAGVKIKTQLENNGEYEDFPIILDVPISYQKSGDSVLYMPPQVNDIVLVVFSKYSLDNMLVNNATVPLTDERRFSINDAMIVGGFVLGTDLVNAPTLTTGDVLLHHASGAGIKIDADGNVILTANTFNVVKL
jgi:hypothetical protein